MKKTLVPLLLSLCLLLCGCAAGPQTQSAAQEKPPAAAPAQTEAPVKTEAPAVEATAEPPAPVTEAPASPAAPAETETPAAQTSPLVGSWQYYAQEGINGGTTVTHEEVEQYRAQGYGALVDMTLRLYEDGSCELLWIGDLSVGSWTDNGDGTGSMTMEGKTLALSIEDGMLLSLADDNLSRFERCD